MFKFKFNKPFLKYDSNILPRSAIFHARDVKWTEAMDYHSATAQIYFSVWMAAYRLAGPPPPAKRSVVHAFDDDLPLFRRAVRTLAPRSPRRLLSRALSLTLPPLYVAYVLMMSVLSNEFDYGLHMRINIVGFVLHQILWAVWAISHRDRPYVSRLVTFLVGLMVAGLLEVLDFPPLWGLLDAHACWHAATVPLLFIWYQFLKDDAAWEVKHGCGVEEFVDLASINGDPKYA